MACTLGDVLGHKKYVLKLVIVSSIWLVNLILVTLV